MLHRDIKPSNILLNSDCQVKARFPCFFWWKMGSDEEDAGMTMAMVMVVVDDDCHVQRLLRCFFLCFLCEYVAPWLSYILQSLVTSDRRRSPTGPPDRHTRSAILAWPEVWCSNRTMWLGLHRNWCFVGCFGIENMNQRQENQKKTLRSWKVGSVNVFFVEGGCRTLLRTNIHWSWEEAPLTGEPLSFKGRTSASRPTSYRWHFSRENQDVIQSSTAGHFDLDYLGYCQVYCCLYSVWHIKIRCKGQILFFLPHLGDQWSHATLPSNNAISIRPLTKLINGSSIWFIDQSWLQPLKGRVRCPFVRTIILLLDTSSQHQLDR